MMLVLFFLLTLFGEPCEEPKGECSLQLFLIDKDRGECEEGAPFLTEKDIKKYIWCGRVYHKIVLENPSTFMLPDVVGPECLPFVLVLDGNQILDGCFVSPYSSRSRSRKPEIISMLEGGDTLVIQFVPVDTWNENEEKLLKIKQCMEKLGRFEIKQVPSEDG